jgi:methyltransferase (TIGR00027 family)
MEKARASTTAQGTAIMRAMHQMLDDEPKILVDPVALRLIEPETFEAIRKVFEQLPPALSARLRAMFVLRSRYAEDSLAESFKAGVRQYVILGAGLDTFAFRQPPWAKQLSIFEVDYPATQQWKRGRLEAAGISVPGNVRFVAVDFEGVMLSAGLSGAEFDLAAPAFFSLLGVSQYLSENALDETLKLVLAMPASSEIVFTFVLRDEDLPEEEIRIAAMSAASAAAGGEPWLTRFNPLRIEAKLRSMGFRNVIRLSPEDAYQRYFASRRDGLKTFVMEQMIRAIV